jgi:hypothetical protein
MLEYRNNLSSAQNYARKGLLEEWIHSYLLTDANNKEFSDGLKLFERFYLGPIKMPLSLFNRCCGPEDSMKWKVSLEGFEKKVSMLLEAIENDNDMPPLIVQYVDDEFELNDGNHRYEAYKRLGIKEIYVVVWITKKRDYELFNLKFAEYIK